MLILYRFDIYILFFYIKYNKIFCIQILNIKKAPYSIKIINDK